MKKWLILAVIVCVGVVVQAAEGEGKKKDKGGGSDVTKEQYVASAKKRAEKKGKDFNQAKVEATFDKLDANKDGKLSADERPAPKGKKNAE